MNTFTSYYLFVNNMYKTKIYQNCRLGPDLLGYNKYKII